MEISIIVPVYNNEDSLSKCLDSILSQTFVSFELILVDDGSTDKSGEICDEYSMREFKVKVVHKENEGPSSARNTGLEIAKGNYIGFVDCDDYINKYMYETLYQTAIKYVSDIVMCDFQSVSENTSVKTTLDLDYEVNQFNHIEILNQIYLSDSDYTTFIVSWNKLYKRELFHDIKYDTDILYDDETVAHKLYYQSKRVTYIHANLYYYVQRDGSIIHSPINASRLDRVYALKNREVFFKTKQEVDLQQKALKHFVEIFFKDYYAVKKQLKNANKDLRKVKRLFDKSLISILQHKEITFKRKALYILFSTNPTLFEFVQSVRSKITENKQSSA